MREKVQFKISIPADVKAWLEAEARRNVRSQGSEIIAILRERMAARPALTD